VEYDPLSGILLAHPQLPLRASAFYPQVEYDPLSGILLAHHQLPLRLQMIYPLKDGKIWRLFLCRQARILSGEVRHFLGATPDLYFINSGRFVLKKRRMALTASVFIYFAKSFFIPPKNADIFEQLPLNFLFNGML